jgi:hypothetical protein
MTHCNLQNGRENGQMAVHQKSAHSPGTQWDISPTCRQPNTPDNVKRCGVVRSARNANPTGTRRTPQDAPERGVLMWQPSHHPRLRP